MTDPSLVCLRSPSESIGACISSGSYGDHRKAPGMLFLPAAGSGAGDGTFGDELPDLLWLAVDQRGAWVSRREDIGTSSSPLGSTSSSRDKGTVGGPHNNVGDSLPYRR